MNKCITTDVLEWTERKHIINLPEVYHELDIH